MYDDLEDERSEANIRVLNFRPSSINEIKELCLNKDDKCEIEVVDYCPFTGIIDTTTLDSYIDDIQIKGSQFEMCFIYTDDYGNDSISSLEDTKIIKKYKE